MKFYSLLLPILLNIIFSTVADLHDPLNEELLPSASFPSRLPKRSDPSKAGFKKVNCRRIEKASQPRLPQLNPFSIFTRNCDSADHAVVNYSPTPTRFPILGPKNGYFSFSFTALPVAPMAYSTTTRPTTPPMTHSAPAPAHITPIYDAVVPLLYAASQPLTYPTTTPRTASPTRYSVTMPCRHTPPQLSIPKTSTDRAKVAYLEIK